MHGQCQHQRTSRFMHGGGLAGVVTVSSWLAPDICTPACIATYRDAGYLPSFWIKLRLLAVPAVNSAAVAATVPPLLGGPTHLTVGLIAAFVAVSCIIAADTGAYFCGKSFGRTQVRLGLVHASNAPWPPCCVMPHEDTCWFVLWICAPPGQPAPSHCPSPAICRPPSAADGCEPQEDRGGCCGRPAQQHCGGTGAVQGGLGAAGALHGHAFTDG